MKCVPLHCSVCRIKQVHRIIATNDCPLFSLSTYSLKLVLRYTVVNLYKGNLCIKLNFTSHSVYDRRDVTYQIHRETRSHECTRQNNSCCAFVAGNVHKYLYGTKIILDTLRVFYTSFVRCSISRTYGIEG